MRREPKAIVWDVNKLRAFQEARNKAESLNKVVFKYGGHEFEVGYAKYLVSYLEKELKVKL